MELHKLAARIALILAPCLVLCVCSRDALARSHRHGRHGQTHTRKTKGVPRKSPLFHSAKTIVPAKTIYTPERTVIASLAFGALLWASFSAWRKRKRPRSKPAYSAEAMWGQFSIMSRLPAGQLSSPQPLRYFLDSNEAIFLDSSALDDAERNEFYNTLYTQANAELLYLIEEEARLEQMSPELTETKSFQLRRLFERRQVLLQRRDYARRNLGSAIALPYSSSERAKQNQAGYFLESLSA